MYLRWKDKGDAYIISACIYDNISNITKKGIVEQVLETIETYNITMGGVDRSDQMLTGYKKLERKRLKK